MDIYEYLIYNCENKYKREFEFKWNRFLTDLNLSYTKSRILHFGNRFRPRLVAFGFLFSKNNLFEDFPKVADVGVCIEAVHKASLIIDDIIDNDSQRYGEKAFHVQFGVNETIAFSVHLIGKAFAFLNKCFFEYTSEIKIISQAIDLYSNIISGMSFGAIKEMQKMETTLGNVKMITNLETSILIRNSLLIGYYFGGNINEEVVKIFSEIGDKCGELYQFMNDLEPFTNPAFNSQHKGKINADFNHYRKNIVATLIAEEFGNEKLSDLLMGEIQINSTENEHIFGSIKQNMMMCYKNISGLIKHLQLYADNEEWIENFRCFFYETVKWGALRTRLQMEFLQ